jgi:hypothetical protein
VGEDGLEEVVEIDEGDGASGSLNLRLSLALNKLVVLVRELSKHSLWDGSASSAECCFLPLLMR